MSDLRKPPPPPKPNERKHPRQELLASVELHHRGETLILPARNLSLGGIFLGADGNDLAMLKVGAEVELLVFNASDEKSPAVRAPAEVVRHDHDGVGLKWREDKKTRKQIASLLHDDATRR